MAPLMVGILAEASRPVKERAGRPVVVAAAEAVPFGIPIAAAAAVAKEAVVVAVVRVALAVTMQVHPLEFFFRM